MTGSGVRLEDVVGAQTTLPLGEVLTGRDLEWVSTPRGAAPLPPTGMLEVVPEPVMARARWWERHLIELLTGVAPDAAHDSAPQSGYDPRRHTLRQRELAKLTELRAAGHSVSFTTIKRLRAAYERQGLWGLVDQRYARVSGPTGRVDQRVVDATVQAIDEETNRSTGTVERLARRVTQILAAEHGNTAPALPSTATFYRLVGRLTQGRHTFGSAKTRRSLAKTPKGPFGSVPALRPGQWVHIDSTPIDVRVVLDNGVIDRAELTWLVDLATRSIPAAVLRPTTKAADAAVLLARALTPEPMRPGWVDAVRMSRSVLPHRRLTALDDQLTHAAARPVIVPETIVCDNGKAYVSQTFRTACRAMGINLQPTHLGSPWENGAVERSFNSVGTLFAQYVAGYVGRSVEHRGKSAEKNAVWSIVELQALLDEWIVTVWQNRPHDGLRNPLAPDTALTPNEQYAALVEVAGYVPVALNADDYVELLPVSWNRIGRAGIKLNRRTYDDNAIDEYNLRGEHSGVIARDGRWEVHFDPYDVTRIWVRNHRDGGWITVGWKHLRTAPMPFGEVAWQHARNILGRRGEDTATEAQIAAAAARLLDRAEQGPEPKVTTPRDRRVAGRTRSTNTPSGPRPNPPGQQDAAHAVPAAREDDPEPLAEVIPLPLFDAREEARRWSF
ncbi:Mu transposase C-terminal domain-containing protein [Micromonospora sp. NPDC053740]|uniref:Mu transposase C-terminal domain-containing protein n=1 Tax=Micromonospora sp. NPDC053740 TaxID=3155173 RepID=UPI003419DAD3